MCTQGYWVLDKGGVCVANDNELANEEPFLQNIENAWLLRPSLMSNIDWFHTVDVLKLFKMCLKKYTQWENTMSDELTDGYTFSPTKTGIIKK